MTTPTTTENLDDLIEQEKKALAREYFDEVWSNASADGIDADLIAEIFIENALNRLVTEIGNEEASKLIAHFKKLDDMGFLPANHTLQ